MSRNKVTRNNSTRTSGNNAALDDAARRREFELLLGYQGAISRVARQLNLSRTHVSYVARGQRRSARVEKALLLEIERIKRDSQRAA